MDNPLNDTPPFGTTSAPLGTTSAQQAAETMISEGGPVSRKPTERSVTDEALQHCKAYGERVLEQVDRHPFYSVGIAFSFGLVLGLLVEP